MTIIKFVPHSNWGSGGFHVAECGNCGARIEVCGLGGAYLQVHCPRCTAVCGEAEVQAATAEWKNKLNAAYLRSKM